MCSLLKNIQEIIRCDGGISFAQFMQLALYSPKQGYYEIAGRTLGTRGDFITSVSVGPLFGRLLASRFADWLAHISSESVHLVEIGAHQGTLAKDILRGISADSPHLLPRLDYSIVEPSTTRRDWQQKNLQSQPVPIYWLNGLEAFPQGSVNGIIFANELLDAFPVHRLGWNARTRDWFEWWVGSKDGQLCWIRKDAIDDSLREELTAAGLDVPEALSRHLPDDFTVEISPQARLWWKQAASRLGQGILITLDYGLTAEDLFSPGRSQGTARAYRHHRLEKDLLQHPGQQDLTAHVNFTQIRRAGHEAGLKDLVWDSQETFLVGVLEQCHRRGDGWLRETEEWKAAFQTLTHPSQLGRAFRVLAQGRGMGTQPLER